jgi:hypothetical protein
MSRSRLLIGASILIVFAAGVGLGMLAQRGLAKNALEGDRGIAGERGPVSPAPPLEDWRYPDAVGRGYVEAPRSSEHGRSIGQREHLQFWSSSDDYDKVVAFYVGKCGFQQSVGSGSEGIQTNDDGSWAHLGPRDPGQQCLRRCCESYDLTVLISRIPEAERTQIVLVYGPKVVGSVPSR